MKPVYQTIIDIKNGDCIRACVASLLELPIDAVPNFIRFGQKWFHILRYFLLSIDYDCYGTGFTHSHKIKEYTVKKFVIGSVPSKSFKNTNHSVIINCRGLCVHDPNPNKLWKGINVKNTKDLKNWLLIDKKGKKECDR